MSINTKELVNAYRSLEAQALAQRLRALLHEIELLMKMLRSYNPAGIASTEAHRPLPTDTRNQVFVAIQDFYVEAILLEVALQNGGYFRHAEEGKFLSNRISVFVESLKRACEGAYSALTDLKYTFTFHDLSSAFGALPTADALSALLIRIGIQRSGTESSSAAH